MPHQLSIVIPTLNEVDNIDKLIERIDITLSDESKYKYEIVFVDDHSDDGTIEKIKSIEQESAVSIHLYIKQGERGKAFSLMEGFNHAKFDTICMIDADLQYPPEAIARMLELTDNGNNIVVANRVSMEIGAIRRSLSKVGKNIYGQWLHGLTCDVQSGLKIFKKDILSHITLSPRQWTFDLEFLVQAKNRGYSIATLDVDFAKRDAGTSKINVFTSGAEILIQAVKLKFRKYEQEAASKIDSIVIEQSEDVRGAYDQQT